MALKDILQTVIAIGVVVGMVLGAINYFASAKDLQLVSIRLDQKIATDQALDIQKRMWQLEDRNGGPDFHRWRNERDKDEYRRLQQELLQKQKQLKELK